MIVFLQAYEFMVFLEYDSFEMYIFCLCKEFKLLNLNKIILMD